MLIAVFAKHHHLNGNKIKKEIRVLSLRSVFHPLIRIRIRAIRIRVLFQPEGNVYLHANVKCIRTKQPFLP